jgi:diguanylate cyclase (GGDEF)-like protein
LDPISPFPEKLSIRTIIREEKITAFYQPFISIKRKSLTGFEGLIRGLDGDNAPTLSPVELFSRAAEEGCLLELDRLCRKKVLETFLPAQKERRDLILSFNLDAWVTRSGAVGSGHLLGMVRELGMDPSGLCVEIAESALEDGEALMRFVEAYRGHGFLIALDNVDASRTNLNRLLRLKPDIVKIDLALVQGLRDNAHKQEVYKSLVSLCRTVGSFIVAKGVETPEEGQAAFELGADMVQGFYFSRPLPAEDCLKGDYGRKIAELTDTHREREVGKLQAKRLHLARHRLMIDEMQQRFSAETRETFDRTLAQMAAYYPVVECFFILDETGTQISETFQNPGRATHRNSKLFFPAPQGSDHTLKDYYFVLIQAGLGKVPYISEPYLSLASGRLCVTLSALFTDADKMRRILCLDISTQDFSVHQGAMAIEYALLYERTREIAITDHLTGLYNFGYFMEKLREERLRAERYHRMLSLVILDIDHFKKYNDTHGHPAGNEVIQKIAQILRTQVRETDIVARYGGEEVAMILPEIGRREAFEVAERIRVKVSETDFGQGEKQVRVTLSAGVATFPVDCAGEEELIKRADVSLYQAKTRGRNRVVAFDPPHKVTITYRPHREMEKVVLAGNFNNWGRDSTAMQRQSDGTFQSVLSLNPGLYQYKFLVDDREWIQDPHCPETAHDGLGGRNSILQVKA